MIKYFEMINEIDKNNFIDLFKLHELKREPKDDYARNVIIKGLEQSNVLSYYRCRSKRDGLNDLILPHHNHNGVITGQWWGNEFEGVVSDVAACQEWRNSDCVKKFWK